MIKQAVSAANLSYFAVTGLVIFVAVFAMASLWVLSRSRKEVSSWSSLPLADGHEPLESIKK